MTIGARELLDKYGGSRLAVAEAFLRKGLKTFEEERVEELVSLVILEAAKFRLLHPDACVSAKPPTAAVA